VGLLLYLYDISDKIKNPLFSRLSLSNGLDDDDINDRAAASMCFLGHCLGIADNDIKSSSRSFFSISSLGSFSIPRRFGKTSHV
jgi:hypothetical protein